MSDAWGGRHASHQVELTRLGLEVCTRETRVPLPQPADSLPGSLLDPRPSVPWSAARDPRVADVPVSPRPCDTDDFTDAEAISAVIRITSGNFRLVQRLFSRIERVLQINELRTITKEVVEAARENPEAVENPSEAREALMSTT
jgi:hypothetical protein